jgi:glutathione S-transferase
MITLYQFGNSVCCQKVRITLREKGLDWSAVEVNLFKNEQYDPAYLKLNPAGVVPTLQHGDDVVTESTLICEYLDELHPAPPLMPATPVARAQVRRWSKIVDEGLHEGVSEISFSAMFRERMKAMSEAERQIRFENVGDPKRRDRFMSTFEHGARSPFVLHAVAAFERAFARLETHLSDGRAWIMGDAPTLADIAIMPYIGRLHFLGLVDLWIGHRPAVRRWFDRVQDWPSYQAEIVQPMRDVERAEMAEHGTSIRDDIAEMLATLRAAEAARAMAVERALRVVRPPS